MIYYTDGTHEVAGTLDGMVGVGGTSDTVDIYTDALDFYPINGGTEYGVKIGKAIYLERIEIPATYNGLPVTTILAEGFVSEDSSVLEEVIIPNSITKICASAFSGCENITEIKIPASVTYIGEYAFVGVPTVYAEISESERPDGWSEEMGMDKIVWLG